MLLRKGRSFSHALLYLGEQEEGLIVESRFAIHWETRGVCIGAFG